MWFGLNSQMVGLACSYIQITLASLNDLSLICFFFCNFFVKGYPFTISDNTIPKYEHCFFVLLKWIIIIIIIIELTDSKTILENTFEIKPQPVALDFKNRSQYSSRSK